jgi:predicted small metal-binding protein
MEKIIQCPCGFIIRADSEEKLVAAAQKHAKETHDMELTTEQALAMARPA